MHTRPARFLRHCAITLRAFAIAGATLLAACGGGGKGATTTGSGDRLTATPLAVKATSYLNFKDVGLTPTSLPVTGDTRTYGDFARSGNLDLFMAELTYSPDRPIGSATPARFKFWKLLSDGGYTEDTDRIDSNGVAACIHPRKALTADFNGDMVPDVFVSCHGYDNNPYPGERSRLLLSQANGKHRLQEALPVGYWHGATAFDVDGDGDIDLMLVDNNDSRRGVTFLNDGAGNFTKDTVHRFPASIASKGYYSIEAIDINADGKQDLVLGGLEYDNSPTLVLINPGNGDFSSVTSATLPTDSTYGIVLDFTVTQPGAQPILWTVRTRHSPFYTGYAIQRIDLSANTASLGASSSTGNWLRWAIPTVIGSTSYIASDNKADSAKAAY